ncbi:MAG: HD domain-containing phosphohydrolase [Cohaesibacteraceae bacterium]
MSSRMRVLLVDDDERLLNAARRVLRKEIELVTAEGGKNALDYLQNNGPFEVIVSDQNMPDMKGVELLAHVAKRWPTTVRVMLTGNDDQQTAIKAVNEGQIYRFINKPCGPEDLLTAITAASKHHQYLLAEKALLEETLSGSVKVLTDVLALSKPNAFKRSSDVHRWAKRLADEIGIERPWELDLAAMLCTLGAVTIPDSVTRKHYAGETLSEKEQLLLERVPANGRDLLRNVPRMEGIAEAIYYSKKGFDGSGFPSDEVSGETIPVIGRLLKVLLDLAEATVDEEVSFADAIEALNRNAEQYDPQILGAVEANLATDQLFAVRSGMVRKNVDVNALLEGDVTATDISDLEGTRLLVSGSTLTNLTIKRLKNIEGIGQMPRQVEVWRLPTAA